MAMSDNLKVPSSVFQRLVEISSEWRQVGGLLSNTCTYMCGTPSLSPASERPHPYRREACYPVLTRVRCEGSRGGVQAPLGGGGAGVVLLCEGGVVRPSPH